MGEKGTEVAEVDTKKEGLFLELQDAIKTAQTEREYRPDEEEQGRKFAALRALVFGGMDDDGVDLVEELRGHLRAVRIEEQTFAAKQKREERPINDAQVLRGKLFEELIRKEKLESKSSLANEMLALAHDPERFDLEDFLGMWKNPDLAIIKITDSGFVIEAIGEAKLGLLDRRAFDQLKKWGFWEGLSETVRILNHIDNLSKCGLKEIGQRKGKGEILIAPSFKQHVFIPANRNSEDIRSLIDQQKGGLSEEETERFIGLLENKKLISIEKSVFSTHDVVAMAEVLLKKIG